MLFKFTTTSSASCVRVLSISQTLPVITSLLGRFLPVFCWFGLESAGPQALEALDAGSELKTWFGVFWESASFFGVGREGVSLAGKRILLVFSRLPGSLEERTRFFIFRSPLVLVAGVAGQGVVGVVGGTGRSGAGLAGEWNHLVILGVATSVGLLIFFFLLHDCTSFLGSCRGVDWLLDRPPRTSSKGTAPTFPTTTLLIPLTGEKMSWWSVTLALLFLGVRCSWSIVLLGLPVNWLDLSVCQTSAWMLSPPNNLRVSKSHSKSTSGPVLTLHTLAT